MPRKSTGGAASGASVPSTPIAKGLGSRKSLNGTSGTATPPSAVDVDSTVPASTTNLVVPASTKLVLKQQEVALKGIESYELPRGPLIKLAKSSLPDNVQLRRDVQFALVRSASVFISYLTATAHDTARRKKKKNILPEHVMEAMREIELGDADVMRELKVHLLAFREGVVKKKSEKASVGSKAADATEPNDADVSRLESDDMDADESTRDDVEQGGSASLLNRRLADHADQDQDDNDDGDGADELMDED